MNSIHFRGRLSQVATSLHIAALRGSCVMPDRGQKRLGTRFFFALAFTASTAFAAVNNCPGGTGGPATGSISRTVSGGPTYNNVTVPGGSTTNNIGTATLSGATGCTALDLTFNNFSLTSSGSSDVVSGTADAAGTYVTITPTGTTQTSSDALLFSTLQGDGTGGNGAINDGVNNLNVNNSLAFTSTLQFDVTDSVGTGIFNVNQSANDISLPSGASGSLTIFTFASHPTYVDVTQVIALTCSGCGGNEAALMTWGDQFVESPEPSTFVLLGTALALVGLLQFRARRRAGIR